MALIELPPELQHIIYSCCEGGDVQALRLACHATNNVASDLLLPRVSTFFHRTGIERLLEVIRLPAAIRRGVKGLNFHVDAYEEWEDFEAWDHDRWSIFFESRTSIDNYLGPDNKKWFRGAALSESVKESLASFHRDNIRVGKEESEEEYPEDDRKLLQRAFSYRQELQRNQTQMVKSSFLRQTIGSLLRACPNLTEMKFTSRGGSSIKITALEPVFQKGMCTPHGPFHQSGLAVYETLLAVHDVDRRLKHLSVAEMGQYNGMTNWYPHRDQGIVEVVRSVETIDFSFGRAFTDEWEGYNDIVNVGDLINNMEDDFVLCSGHALISKD